ncbi:MAG: cytochrome [Rhodospirillales bacterium]|nr:cytochrome [Rhodospirillales bacterium]
MTQAALEIPAHVPPGLVVRFDFRRDPRMRTDPWGLIRELTDKPDIFYTPELGGYWVVTRNALVAETFRRHDLFSNQYVTIPKIPDAPPLIPNNIDPPDHAKYRKFLAQKMFSPRALASLESDARKLMRDWADKTVPTGACDFVPSFAQPMPVDLFLRMMDLPPDRREMFMPWVRGVFRPETPEEGTAAFRDLAAYLYGWLDERIANPTEAGGHMLPAMLAAEVDGRKLNRDEMVSIWMMLFLGGLDTVTAQMTHVMRFLAENPRHRQQLLDDPALIKPAIEELLRRFGIANIARVVRDDCDYHGVAMKAGDMVLCSTPIAGLDPTAFANPEIVDFGRVEADSHWAFGAGIHICPGAYLARLELRIMVEELLPRLPEVHVPVGGLIEASSGGTLSLTTLPLAWKAD